IFTCPTGWLVSLQQGYYDDAASLTKLTGGSCQNKVLLLNSGVYYFDFDFASAPTDCASNATVCTWTISGSASGNNPASGTNVVAGLPKGGWDAAPGGPRPTIPSSGACMTLADGAA